MQYFNQLILSSIQYSASHIYFIPNTPPAIKTLGRIEFLQLKNCSTIEIEKIIESVLTEEAYNLCKSKNYFTTTLNFNQEYQLNIHIIRSISQIKMVIQINKKTSYSLSELNIPIELLKTISSASKGLIIVTGAPHHNKDITINALLDEINNNQKKHVLIFSNDNAFHKTSNKSIISSYNLSQVNFEFIKNQSADIVILGCINSTELIHIANNCIAIGTLVIALVDAVSVTYAIEKIISLFPHRQSGLNTLSYHLLGIMLQVFITSKIHNNSLYLYDFIKCNSKVQNLIQEDKLQQINSSNIKNKINELIEQNKLTYHDVQIILSNLSNTQFFYDTHYDIF
ncbi:ATPase, T2SS/T4P/T4SS family [Candidatus Neoehrlichia procyonis]|uniref:Type II/IV secretion system family protein n=1 Tax=Candidatus Neoehrlichia procyonis str. RAC413 TaxID=1359163 RepID=A0A0F3NPN2_9RICK|nr:ATPase, T2SS/T4P/T4SS family [Candidatus Neoehrlichia lotoris]KJV69637.1 type II/IV secretion system family protein [Candidatus Neoehrlichia lotoris str. RAC413]